MKTIKQLAWTFLCCFSIWQQALAQDQTLEKKTSFRVGVGIGYYKTLDLQYSANAFKTVLPNLNLGFTRSSTKGAFSADLNVAMGPMNAAGRPTQKIYITDTDFYGVDNVEIHDLAFSQMRLQFEIGYLRDLPAISNRIKIKIGGALAENFSYTPAIIYPGTINYVSLNVKTGIDYQLNNGKVLNFGFAFPLVSLVTRMPYHNSPLYPDKTNIRAFFTGNNTWETVNHFQNANLSVKYNWYTGKKISMDVKLEASWLHYNKPEHVTCAGGQLSLGINF